MFIIPCPYCGDRDQSEYAYGGQAHVARPANPENLSDAEWAEFVFFRDNPKGPFAERWNHASGCRRWFNVIRSTATDRILAVYKMGAPRPELDLDRPATPCGEVAGSGNDAVKLVSADAGTGAAR
ncbi:sarcosine oxidase subunit delta [Amorphus sp. 3PC139-8]